MTISGQMIKSQQLLVKLAGGLIGLTCGLPVLGFGLMPFFVPSRQLDTSTQTAALVLGPVIIALGIGFSRWFNADAVAEFACDGSSFRFRKIGSDHAETRDLSDVAKVLRDRGAYGAIMSYRLVFRDATEATLMPACLPNAKVFAEWLRSRIQRAGRA